MTKAMTAPIVNNKATIVDAKIKVPGGTLNWGEINPNISWPMINAANALAPYNDARNIDLRMANSSWVDSNWR
jgi:hypothetical protein